MSDVPLDGRLSELEQRTRSVAPRPGFQARVLEALAARAHATLRTEVWQSARVFVPAALLLTALAIGLAAFGAGPSSTDIAVAEQRWERDF